MRETFSEIESVSEGDKSVSEGDKSVSEGDRERQ